MNRRFKWSILALLGFSTACSSVKNTAKKDPATAERADSTAVEGKERPQIIVMYGVRPPVGDPMRDSRPAERVEYPQQPAAPAPADSVAPASGAGENGSVKTPQTDR